MSEDEQARLTAYVLGELDELERKRVETELGKNPDLAQEMAELETTAALLGAALGEDLGAATELEDSAKEKISEAAQDGGAPAPVVELRPQPRRWLLLSAIAATTVAAAAGLHVSSPDDDVRAGNVDHASRSHANSQPGDGYADSVGNGKRYAVPMASGVHAPREFGLISLLPRAQGKEFDKVLDPTLPRSDAPPLPESGFLQTSQERQSTFSIDVDTASYSLVRKYLGQNQLPPAGRVRIEELINYFSYDYPPPQDGRPFSLHAETAPAPWAKGHLLVKLGVQAKKIASSNLPPSNLVFLVDVSGSMQGPQRLGLLRRALGLLVRQLREQDHVSIVVYAGNSGVLLDPTSGAHPERILAALDQLEAGGSTHGSAGINSAYALAQRHFKAAGINRVILATDGDFNVGLTDHGALKQLVAQRAKSGVFLSVLAFGNERINDSLMETIADNGNGNYAYIDSFSEAKKVLLEQAAGTLLTVAKDVKIQVELNPKRVQSYRLIGYDNRRLANEDFADDQVDAGEIGAGHSVTALYELVLRPGSGPSQKVMDFRVRYKTPQGSESQLVTADVTPRGGNFAASSDDFKVATAAAALGLSLRGSAYRGELKLSEVESWLKPTLHRDPAERRRELLELVTKARRLKPSEP